MRLLGDGNVLFGGVVWGKVVMVRLGSVKCRPVM